MRPAQNDSRRAADLRLQCGSARALLGGCASRASPRTKPRLQVKSNISELHMQVYKTRKTKLNLQYI
jgi:hypothetical protein